VPPRKKQSQKHGLPKAWHKFARNGFTASCKVNIVKIISTLRIALGLTKPYRLRFSLGLICGVIAGLADPLLMVSVKLVFELLFPQQGALPMTPKLQKMPAFLQHYMKDLEPWLTHLVAHRPSWLILSAILTIPTVMFCRGFFTYLNVYLMNWVSLRAICDLRTKVFEHLLGLHASFFNKMSTGELMSRLDGVSSLQGLINSSLVTMVKEPVTILGLGAILITLQPRLTLLSAVIFPIAMVPTVIFARKVRKDSAATLKKGAEMSTLTHEAFTGYRIIKAYNLEPKIIDEFDKGSRAGIGFRMRVLRSSEIPGPLMEFFGAAGVACFFIYIAFYSKHPVTSGDLFQFLGSMFLMYAPIKSLIRLNNQLQQADVASRFTLDLLAITSDIADPTKPLPLKAAHADIQIDNVSFSYGDKPALNDVSLEVKAGQIVALVGSSGSGKTTLTNMLLRFYDPQTGAIRIGGTDIRDVALRDLRSQIAIVTQETVLFNDTIRNNIAVGHPGSTAEEITTAATHAYAHDFIMEKPQGYDTQIGERGVSLSGGQRQRVAIARAILKNAPILILDEATSALDTESERAIQSALDELMRNRTTIVVAHRLSTVQNADKIVVLSEGRIVEQGTHSELLQLGGQYKKLYDLQFAV
jgi:subfamily B ATP-binding cassette protein MsbA